MTLWVFALQLFKVYLGQPCLAKAIVGPWNLSSRISYSCHIQSADFSALHLALAGPACAHIFAVCDTFVLGLTCWCGYNHNCLRFSWICWPMKIEALMRNIKLALDLWSRSVRWSALSPVTKLDIVFFCKYENNNRRAFKWISKTNVVHISPDNQRGKHN